METRRWGLGGAWGVTVTLWVTEVWKKPVTKPTVDANVSNDD